MGSIDMGVESLPPTRARPLTALVPCYIMPRSLVECIQFVRRTTVETTVHVITTGVPIALLTDIAMKLRLFGPKP
jgi:hypothetical protein